MTNGMTWVYGLINIRPLYEQTHTGNLTMIFYWNIQGASKKSAQLIFDNYSEIPRSIALADMANNNNILFVYKYRVMWCSTNLKCNQHVI